MKPSKSQTRRGNNQKFIPTALPKYLCRDIDNFMIKTNREGSRASFIVRVLNDYLDEQIYSDLMGKSAKGKVIEPIPARAHRYMTRNNLGQGIKIDEKIERRLLELYKKLSEEIEKD